MAHKFILVGVKQVESHFKLNPEYSSNQKKIAITYDINVSYKYKADGDLQVVVAANSQNPEQPFTFSVAVLGKFKFEDSPDKETVEKIAKINCAAIIFPFVRESVADLTRRASVRPFQLDIINFMTIYEENQQRQREEAELQDQKQ